MTLSFQKAVAHDIPQIQRLAESIWNACYPSMISKEQIRYMLSWMYTHSKLETELERGVQYDLMLWEATAVGYLAWELSTDGNSVFLNKLYLDPKLHGLGLGQLALNRVLQAARQAGAQTVELRVNKGNARALRAYERAGFQIADAVVADIGGGFVMDDFILRREVGPHAAPRGT